MKEQKRYEIIKALAESPNPNKQRASLELDCTVRTINRLLKGYKEHKKEYFVHGNRGRKPVNAIDSDKCQKIVELYRTKYYDANFTHFAELLVRNEDIHVSVSSIRSILEAEGIFSPKITKAKKKRIKKQLEAAKKEAGTKKEVAAIQANIVAVEDAHSRRPRCAYFGEMIQIDASSYEWVRGQNWHLHVAVDDATGAIVGAFFDTEETLNGYYHVFDQILHKYGIPYKFFTDRRTVFIYQKTNSSSLDEDTYTQFAYACKQLGVQIETSSVPQAKGRVERLNETLQSRLPIEMRLEGVTTIEQANEFLHSYIAKFNSRFALPVDNIKSVFEMQPPDEKINLLLSVLSERVIDTGHCIKYRNKYYRLLDKEGTQVYFMNGTKVMVIKAFDGGLYCCVNDTDVYALEEVPERKETSPEFDVDVPDPAPRKRYIPPMNHPWKRKAVLDFAKKQWHHRNDTIPQT